MKYLLLPGNNALSHVAKALAVRRALLDRGHEVVLAVGRRRSAFLERLGVPHRVVADIQEVNHAPSPSFIWFKPGRFLSVVSEEAELIEEVSPDRVLGIFRFTAPVSARSCGVPYDSLICGCLLPNAPEVLGFARDEPGRAEQAEYLHFFYFYCAACIRGALRSAGHETITDLRELLLGERTLLWDFPEFQPLEPAPGITHVGPIQWDGWPAVAPSAGLEGIEPGVAVVAFGTGAAPPEPVEKIVRSLLDGGYQVALAKGGQRSLDGLLADRPGLFRFDYAPMDRLLDLASVLICHGGQHSVFEALLRGVPVVVMPLQPEQAHNGVCLERLGVGARLIPPTPSRGGAQPYLAALDRLEGRAIVERVRALADDPATAGRVAGVRGILGRYGGADDVAEILERA